MMGRSIKIGFLSMVVSLFLSCKDKPVDTDSFTFLERNQYTVDTYSGISYYRKNDSTRAIMDGYYVVGNEFTKWEEFDLKEGILNGDYIIFHPNGNIFSHAKYSNGKRHGDELTYALNGDLSKKQTYRNDILIDTVFVYYDNGKIQSQGLVEDGEQIESTSYDLIGNIISQQFIRDSRTITQKIENGKVLSEQISSNYDSFEAIKFFNEDGSLKIFLRMFTEDKQPFIAELDENGDEIKRVNLKENPSEMMKYMSYFKE